MDPLVSERSLAFGEPPVYSSKDFITVQTSERPNDGSGLWYKGGSKPFTISLRNIAQNEMLDTNCMSLQFSVAVVVEAPSGTNPLAVDARLQMTSARDSAVIMPGTPAFGCPFFSSVSAQIPGLGLESFLRSDVESQEIVASRLMCASGVGSYDDNSGRLGYKISGRAYDAGARDVATRAECVWGVSFRTTRGDPLTSPPGVSSPSGVLVHYSVPLSLFTHMANGLSSMLPLSYFASGGDLMSFTFNTAPATTALCQIAADRPDLAGAAAYYIVDPVLSFTKTQINNPSVLAGIEALYRGVSSVPIAPGVSAPMALTLKDIDYTTAFTQVNGAAGNFQLSIPANEPSMRGMLLKFQCNDFINCGLTSTAGQDYKAAGAVGSQWTGKHAFTLQPRLRNLVIRIGSYRVPLDAISDIRYEPTSIPGLSANPFASVQQSTNTVDVLSTRREACRMYAQGKHLFTPWSTDVFEDDALAPFWAVPYSHRQTAKSQYFGTSTFGYKADTNANPKTKIDNGCEGSYVCGELTAPGIFVIPFESFASVLNHRADAFALRGIDLRNITTITVSGTIEGVAGNSNPGYPNGTADGTQPSTSGWTVRAMVAYDRMMVVLPGRTDVSAQFSLLPTGATAVPTM